MSHYGKGAIRAPKDSASPKFRDHPIFAAAVIDWNVAFYNSEPVSNDQNGSLSCVGQGWSYYHEQLKPGKHFSRRDIYAQIALPGGGAYIADGGELIVSFGQATRDEVPDPTPETEAAMTDKSGITRAKEASDKELHGRTVSLDINQWAAAIKECKGVVAGLEGSDAGWFAGDLANPTPPPPNSAEWGHCLYFFGYHKHNENGTMVKCVVAKSSWGKAGGTTVHHIKENYFKSGFMFNAWTLIPKDNRMNQTKVVLSKDGKTVYKAVPIAEDFANFQKQAAVEGIDIPSPIPPASSL